MCRLNIEEVERLRNILETVGGAAGQLPAQAQIREMTGFLALKGHLYNHELMVAGRSVNGWACGVTLGELAGPASREQLVENVLQQDGCPEPMRWVTDGWGAGNGYNTRRSAFWRVSKGVIEGLNVANFEPENWSSHLVWSNLYKVSPAAGRNPSNQLCGLQLTDCIDLFQFEIQIYHPSRLLLLTGADWAEPFLEAFNVHDMGVAGFEYVERAGELALPNGAIADFVVVCHPQGRPEESWTGEVLQVFQHLEH